MPPIREPIEYSAATAEVRAIYEDIMAVRRTDWINNFWKVLAEIGKRHVVIGFQGLQHGRDIR
jgi:hypothetical protein